MPNDKVYIVTSGSYSDYGIRKVFLDKEKAYKYASCHRDYDVEECDTSDSEVVRLMEELAAKDKVLEWYGKPQHYNNWPSPLFTTDRGQRARTILQRYRVGDIV